MGGPLEVTIKRKSGKSPAEILGELREDIRELEDERDALRTEGKRLIDALIVSEGENKALKNQVKFDKYLWGAMDKM